MILDSHVADTEVLSTQTPLQIFMVFSMRLGVVVVRLQL